MRLADFGDDFTWGVATAAYQIEGSPDADGKGPSIWDTFTHRRNWRGKTPIADGTTGDEATDSYRRYAEDIALIRDLGFSAYRFSLSWPRIQPTGSSRVNRAGLDHYRRVIEECLANGIEPWVTLYHWDLPQGLQDTGGWTNRETAHRFTDYAQIVGEALGDLVEHWMLFNEPLNIVISGHLVGNFAPGKRSLPAYFASLHHVNLATVWGSHALRSATSGADIGTTQYLTPPVGGGPGPLADLAARSADAVLNRAFVEPIIGRGYPWEEAGLLRGVRAYIRDGDLDEMTADLDFLGVQYYTRLRAPFLPIPGLWTVPQFGGGGADDAPTTSLGWEIMPEGLGMVLDAMHAYDHFPRLVVTEGGASFDDRVVDGRVHDPARIAYYSSHLAEVAAARERGVPVDGYFAWSLLDNFEWALGLVPRFGLVYTDYATQARIIKDSGYWFAEQLGGSARPG
ncbi:MAG: beta-glucosidase [Actinobacteria bacterium]|nr:beta-glucosidase [Actinomycetota bacterium]MCB9413536.1 beta-glucosidase [Actinomycetota bacterium]